MKKSETTCLPPKIRFWWEMPDPQVYVNRKFRLIAAIKPEKAHMNKGEGGWIILKKWPKEIYPLCVDVNAKKFYARVEGLDYVYDGTKWVRAEAPGNLRYVFISLKLGRLQTYRIPTDDDYYINLDWWSP